MHVFSEKNNNKNYYPKLSNENLLLPGFTIASSVLNWPPCLGKETSKKVGWVYGTN